MTTRKSWLLPVSMGGGGAIEIGSCETTGENAFRFVELLMRTPDGGKCAEHYISTERARTLAKMLIAAADHAEAEE